MMCKVSFKAHIPSETAFPLGTQRETKTRQTISNLHAQRGPNPHVPNVNSMLWACVRFARVCVGSVMVRVGSAILLDTNMLVLVTWNKVMQTSPTGAGTHSGGI